MDDSVKILSVRCVTGENEYILEDGTKLYHGGVRDEYIGKERYLTLLQFHGQLFRLREIDIPKFI